MSKPILCLDFDGVIHRYDSGWKGADVIPDPPVDGAITFMLYALHHFDVVIFSSRSNQPGGVPAMQAWLKKHTAARWWHGSTESPGMDEVRFVTEKPPAFIGIDDRVLTFNGTWPDPAKLLHFKPWNKGELGATGKHPQGKLSDDDEGEIRMAVAYDKLDGIVRLEFGKAVAWLGLPPPEAIQLAEKLLWHARKAKT